MFRNDIGVIYCALDPKSAFLMRSDPKWAYLHEVVAQADKAERLQKEITQELDIYYSPNPSLHPADDCVYAIEKIIGYKRKKSNN